MQDAAPGMYKCVLDLFVAVAVLKAIYCTIEEGAARITSAWASFVEDEEKSLD